MASTAVPEFLYRLPSAESREQRRRSENGILSEASTEIEERMAAVCQRALSEATVAEEFVIKDLDEEESNGGRDRSTAASSPVAIAHIMDIDEDNDGDDEVFDTTPETSDDKGATLVIAVDGQYDDLSSFSTSVQGQEETSHQNTLSDCRLSDEYSKKLTTQVAVGWTNAPDSSHTCLEPTTSTGASGQNNENCFRRQQDDLPFVGSPCSTLREPSSGAPANVTLLERLVRTHPIWYLPHIGRVAAVHLLRGKTPGVFIVRRSSQQNSMAISIKLPPGANQNIEHYLIEKTIAGVHLEGSPNYFRELPFLLAYYCEHGGELHTTLSLPQAILECESLRDLRSLALFGPEFWSSKHCIGCTDHMDDSPLEGYERQLMQHPPSPPVRLHEENLKAGASVADTKQQERFSDCPFEINALVRRSNPNDSQMQRPAASHRRSLSVSGYPVAQTKYNESENTDLTKAAGLQSVCGTLRKPAPFPTPADAFNDTSTHRPAITPKKSPQKEKSILAKLWPESSAVEEGKERNKTTESKEQQDRRSFRFRTLFDVGRRPSVGSPPSPAACHQQKVPAPSLKSKKGKPTGSDQSQIVPRSLSSEIHVSADLTSKGAGRQQAVFYVHRRPAPAPPDSPRLRQHSRGSSPSRVISDNRADQSKPKTDHEYYYFSPANVQFPSLRTALNESRSVSSLLQEVAIAEERQQAESSTPTAPRKRLLTFKPCSPTGDEDETGPAAGKDESALERQASAKPTGTMNRLPMETRQRSAPCGMESPRQSSSPKASPLLSGRSELRQHSFARPSLLRREKSDLGWLPIYNVNKPANTYSMEISAVGHHQRRAALPPNKDDTFKTCIEELRKRRLESLRLQMAANANVVHSRRDGSAHVISSGPPSGKHSYLLPSKSARTSPAPCAIGTLANIRPASSSSSPVGSVLRAKSTRQPGACPSAGQSRRLSAPNLVELSSTVSSVQDGRPAADQLRDGRQQSKPIAGTAGILHTINEGLVTPVARRRAAGSKRHPDTCAERRLSQSLEDLPTTALAPERPRVPPLPVPACFEQTPSGTRANNNYESTVTDVSEFQSSTCHRNEKAFHNETNFQWVAVTNEIRHMQKVAKVTPTQNPYVGKTVGSTSKFSEYVMLNDCADMINVGGNSHNPYRDDAEYGSGRYGSIGGNGVTRQDSQPNTSGQQQDADIDDTRSVVSAAGTVFNEPWDSSAWENLLTLASSMDKNTNSVIASDSRSSYTVSVNSASSSNRPSRVESVTAAETRPSLTSASEETQPTKQHKAAWSRHTALAWADRLKKLRENNIPPPLAPRWEEFSSCVPVSSDSSLPTSTPTNSLENKRKAGQPTTPDTCSARDGGFTDSRHHRLQKAAGNNGPEEGTAAGDRFNLSPMACPMRFRNVGAENCRRADRAKRRPGNDPASKIQECVERLAKDISTFFGAQVQYFIKCTVEGHETDPLAVLGNVRQFMNGLKNYLVKHGECELHPIIEQERSKLRPTEFLNIDAILEGVLQKIVLAPLKPHLYHLLAKEGSSNSSLETLSEHIAIIRNRPLQDFGITGDPCDAAAMEQVRTCLRKMQFHYSPLKKLEYLLNAVALAYEQGRGSPATHSRQSSCGQLPCADELLRWFVYLISRCSMVGCEIESIYMWNLLHPALLAGEASYYLTAFSSAVHVLKHVDLLPKLNDTCSLSSQVGDGGEGFIRVAVPDEVSGAIRYHSFPIMPQLTVARLCRMIARKCGITNPEDYGFYLLIDGYETCLLSTECPELVKEHLRVTNKAHLFAYKRQEAKIAWPKVTVSPRL